MRCSRQKFTDRCFRIDRTIDVGLTTQLFVTEPEFIQRTRRKVAVILPHYRETAPKGISLKSHDDIDSGLALHTADQFKITTHPVLIYDIIWCRQLILCHDLAVNMFFLLFIFNNSEFRKFEH